MNDTVKNKILNSLTSEVSLQIINAHDFYFQKARDILQKYLDLKVNDETKTFLLTNKKEYNELKQLFESSGDFSEFGRIIFTLISYCDSKANRKHEFNQYEDKRVLASASVRMTNWVEQLIIYKFTGQLQSGSIKNAIDYLQKPTDHFTMLSENHRSQISENLFGKAYTETRFVEDFKGFFSEFSISVQNPDNYTHLLTRISYDINTEWKENIIGLICPDTTGWQSDAINDTEDGSFIALWNHKKPNGTHKTLRLLRDCIDENGFFRIFYTSSYKVAYVAEIIDFVTNQDELSKAQWEKNYGAIAWHHEDFSNYTDDTGKSAGWIYLARKISKVHSEDYADFKYYGSFGYPSVGSQAPIVSFFNKNQIEKKILMKQIISLLKYKKQIILQGPPGTGKTRLAKKIANEIIGEEASIIEKNRPNNEYIKLIQFHPSYTYEDFVRGIVTNPNEQGEGVLYEAENKIMADLSQKAYKNYVQSRSNGKEIQVEINTEYKLDKFYQKIVEELGEMQSNEAKDSSLNFFTQYPLLKLTEKIEIFQIDERNIRFASAWRFPGILKIRIFNNIVKAALSGLIRKDQPIPNEYLPSAAKNETYYRALLKKFLEYQENEDNDFIKPESEKFIASPQNYVLIIDEINRANLSSVLGELIYALEYRGKEVDSMYEVDGSTKLILPPNLYIIGTMNTADRSVGHIDYAIRRRFAFVDVLPKILDEDEEIYFNASHFAKVAALFNRDNISPEFESKDVQIGHSYFIVKKQDAPSIAERDELFRFKMVYEVVPILLEYVKDGILIGKVGAEDIKDYINGLKLDLS